MKYTTIFFSIALVSCCFSISINAQEAHSIQCVAGYSSQLSAFSKHHPQEKVYLHFDNTAYYQGETLWFKAYVVSADRHALSSLSRTLYVELITPEGNILETKKLKLANGRCNGEFQLKNSLVAGFYEVRAYTRHMLNGGQDYIFSRVFPCFNEPQQEGDYQNQKMRVRAPSQRIPSIRQEYEQKDKLAVSFYPEGGHLVSGLPTRVAFQTVGKGGDNAIVSGVVFSKSGDSITTFATSHLNIGSFLLTPQAEPYKATVQYNNKEYHVDLPEVLPSGYVMNVEATNPEKFSILVQKSPGLPVESLGLSITCRGQLYGFDSLTIDEENMVSLSFPKKMVPSGVSQITLFNGQGEVLAERMVFVNHHSQMKLEASFDKPSYDPFEKINMDFNLCDQKGNPVETDFSVSIRDGSTTSVEPFTDNLLTNLLLSSELKGYIESPGYYFEKDDQEHKEYLDLLMLTQGWSRYTWKQMANSETTREIHPFEESLLIEGNVLSLYKKKPKKDIEVLMILIGDSTSQHGTCLTDADGRFNLALVDFYGKSKLTLQTKQKNKRKEHIILLDRAFSPDLKAYDWYEKRIPEWPELIVRADTITPDPDSSVTTLLADESSQSIDKKNHLLPEVEVKARRRNRLELEGLRDANIAIDVEETIDLMIDKGVYIPACGVSLLYELLPYFAYYGTENNEQMARYKGKKVTLYLNNHTSSLMELFNTGQNEISLITVKEKYNIVTGTDVSIYVYTSYYRNAETGIRNTKLLGYSYAREFFSPQYDKALLPDEKDYRRTLYWNPDVKTDKNGKASIHFFNNSSCKTMNVSAETVTENGMMGTLCQ